MTPIVDLSSHGKFLKRNRNKDQHLLTTSKDHHSLRNNFHAKSNHSTAGNSNLNSSHSQLMAAHKSRNGKIKRVISMVNRPRSLSLLSKREPLCKERLKEKPSSSSSTNQTQLTLQVATHMLQSRSSHSVNQMARSLNNHRKVNQAVKTLELCST